MNYIGSKASLLKFIEEALASLTTERGVFCDLFAGTGVVGAHLKSKGWSVQANDLQRFSYVRLGALILNNRPPAFEGLVKVIPMLAKLPVSDRAQAVCDHLNQISGIDGYVYQNYALGGTKNAEHQRLYFSDSNARRCDAIREVIEEWRYHNLITDLEEHALLAALLEAIDKVANTASVYGAFLKKLKKTALADMKLKPLPLIESKLPQAIFADDANSLIREISGDVLYLDPPYNQRQYAANYHVLETIARNDRPQLKGKTGLRDWSDQKSKYSSRREVLDTFQDLIENAEYRYILLSYNNEGLMSPEEVERIMSARGEYTLKQKSYPRFRADKDHKDRKYKADETVEYIHCLKVSD